MHSEKYMSMLGLARRAGKLSMGHDMVLEAIKKKKAKLLIFANNASERLEEEIGRSADLFAPELPCVRIKESIDEIHFLLGYKAGVITVNDTNFADRIIELVNQEENEYGDKN